MDDISQNLTSSQMITLVVAVIIFIVCFVLFVRRIFGFILSLVLLFIALTAGYFVLNNDVTKDYFHKYYEKKEVPAGGKEAPAETAPKQPPATNESIQDSVVKAYQDLKDVFQGMMQKFQNFIQSGAHGESKEKPVAPPAKEK